MSVPFFFKLITDTASSASGWNWRKIIFFWSSYYTRTIEHKVIQTHWGGNFSQDRDVRNNVLIALHDLADVEGKECIQLDAPVP